MAGQARPNIEHGWTRMAATGEQRQRFMASGQLVMATAAIIGRMTRSARGTVDRRVLAVNVVFPPRGMRSGFHHIVTGGALSFAGGRRRYVLMANVALG